MKISLNWIKDFVDIDQNLSNDELVHTITLSICEVEGFEETGKHLSSIFVAEVQEIEQHPNADKLSLVTVNYGNGTQKVVCGASNFKVGDKVPFAGEGTRLPGDFVIKKAKIRGVESCGMLCAEDELQFSDDHEGLMILDPSLEIGTTLDQVFPDQLDVVMEIDNKSITHRPDLWGHYGFARELGAVYKLPVKSMPLEVASISGTGEKIIDVEVLAGELVPRFCGLSLDQISVCDSPIWLQHRLSRVGLRPINNMVDLTNYVMLELGQPMHAFDADQIAGSKLVVRLADNGTKVMTLHQKEAVLTENDMTICDANGASVVAGVVGGMDSGVTDQTNRIFLEAANWDPVGIRKTSTRIGLRTDASKRFEKSLDPEMSMLAIQRAVELMKLTNPGLRICGAPVDIVNKVNQPITIKTDSGFICKRLGKTLEQSEIVDILTSLGFVVEENGTELLVDVPSYRRTKDVSIPEDLVEEIGRIHGYNNIEPIAPLFPVDRPVFNLQHQFERIAKSTLSKSRYHEVFNYPLTCQKTEDILAISQDGIMKLKNPVADHQNQMRTSMLPHFMQTILDNQKITHDFKLFETGRIYWKESDGSLVEPTRLVACVSSEKRQLGKSFYQLKHDLINLLSKLQIPAISWSPMELTEKKDYQHKNISASIFSGEALIGSIFSLSPDYVLSLGLKGDVCIADLDLDLLFSMNKPEYLFVPSPKYPAVNFELSIMVPEKTHFQEINHLVSSVSDLVEKVEYLGIYTSEQFNDEKSLSIAIEFRSSDKTLDSDEVKSLQDSVVETLASRNYRLKEA